MDFFDKLGKKASQAYKITADKTGKLAKETKLKIKMNDLKSQIDDIYIQIGKKVYEKHLREEDISIKEELEEQCTKIDVLSDEIDSLLQQCLDLKDKKQCPKCHSQIDKQAKFCPICGKKQTQEPAKEVEIWEKLNNTEIEEEKKEEAKTVKENLDKSLKDNKKKKESKNNKEQEKNKTKKKDEEDNLEKTVKIESNVNLEKEEDENKEEK